MYEDKVRFLELAKDILRAHGLSQKLLSERIGYSPSTVSRVLNGDRSASVDFLRDFCVELKVDQSTKIQLFEFAGLKHLLVDSSRDQSFVKSDILFEEKLADLAGRLHEWKCIHTLVQSLLLATPVLLGEIKQLLENPSFAQANRVEEIWMSFCERKAKKIRELAQSLEYVDSPDMAKLYRQLSGSNSIVRDIWEVNVKDKSSIQQLRFVSMDLRHTLIDVLELADLKIIEIAEEIQTRNSHAESSI